MKARLDILKLMWEKEISNYNVQYSKLKTKNKKTKEFYTRIRNIKPAFKEAILKQYLAKCRIVNAIKFFDWRR